MNYYPNNFYPNYPYNGGYPQYSQPQTQPNIPTQQVTSLQGKIVDGEEVVKATEVPFGGYGVFPKADLSEVYIKTWNNNGTTQVTVFRPVAAESAEKIDTNALILEKIKEIEMKLDNITEQRATKVVSENRKELANNVY